MGRGQPGKEQRDHQMQRSGGESELHCSDSEQSKKRETGRG